MAEVALVVGFHLDHHAHPGMDAALEAMITDSQTAHLHAGIRRHVSWVGRIDALRSARQSDAEWGNASATEGCDFRERMEPATFVHHSQSPGGLGLELRRIEPPRRMPNNCARERRNQEGVKRCQ